MKILHRFGVVCFWACCAVAAANPAIAVLIAVDGQPFPLSGWLQIAFAVVAWVTGGSAIRFVLGWSAKDV